MKNNLAQQHSSPLVRDLLEKRDPLQTAKTQMLMLIAARISDILKELGWKKKDLAERLGKRPSVVTKWLSGTHNFTIDTLIEIEQVTRKPIISLKELDAPTQVVRIIISQQVIVTPADLQFIPKPAFNLKKENPQKSTLYA